MIKLKNPRLTLPQIREAQHQYIQELVKLNKLPGWFDEVKDDLDDPDHQTFIREVIGFLIEEIAEADEQLDKTYLAAVNNDDVDIVLEGIKAHNEEIADVFIFFIELFDLLGISDGDIKLYASVVVEGIPGADALPLQRENILLGLFEVAQSLFNQDNQVMSLYIKAFNYAKYIPQNDYLSSGAQVLGYDLIKLYKADMYDCIVSLGKATNRLKNKPWKSQKQETNVTEFRNYLILSFMEFVSALSVLNFRETQLARLVLHKIGINNKRLLDKR